MLIPSQLLTTSVGRKLMVAITGLLLLGFVIAHLLGNLLIFRGPEAMNAYAKGLHDLGPLLWIARIGLIVLAAVHVAMAIKVSKQNKQARGDEYGERRWLATTASARWMVLTGVMILAFVLYHLLHFTFGIIQHDYYTSVDAQGNHDVYTMVVKGFQNPLIAGSYVVAVSILGIHLNHGLKSFMQTLGLNHPRFIGPVRKFSPFIAGLIVLAYVSIPLSIVLDIVTTEGPKP